MHATEAAAWTKGSKMYDGHNALLGAANALGSSERLASVLGVSHNQLRAWMSGESEPPPQIVADAVRISNQRFAARRHAP